MTQNIVFGIGAGWTLVLFSLHHFFAAVVIGTDWLMLSLPAGVLLLAVTAGAPHWLAGPRHILSRAGYAAGAAVLTLLLAVVYVVLVLPTAALQRWFRGRAPYYAWREAPPRDVEGWVPLQEGPVPTPRNVRTFLLARQFAAMMRHFVRQRKIAYIPLLLILVVVGLILFFAHSSAMAPLIYTLF